MTISELIDKLIDVENIHDAMGEKRITIRIEHENVFAYYDLEKIELDPLTNEIYITTEDKRGVNQVYADDRPSDTQPYRAIKKSIG